MRPIRCVPALFFVCLTPSLVLGLQYGSEKDNQVHAFLESGQTALVEKIIQELENRNDPSRKAQLYHTRAQLSFYRGDYIPAVQHARRAYARAPADQSLENILLFYTAVRDNAEGFIEKKSDHFIVRTKGRDSILADYTLESMERSYRVLGKIFDHYPEEKIIVEIFPDKDQFSLASTLSPETLKRSGAIGICKFHRLMIISPRALLMGYRWLDALSHEFLHLLINHVSAYNTPLWLHEGTARYYEHAWRKKSGETIDPLTPGARAHLMKAVSEDTLIPFKRMHPSMVYLDNQDDVSLAFSEVASMVNYIIKNYGDDAVIRVLRGFTRNTQDKNMKKVLKINAFALEKKWKKFMKTLPVDEHKGALGEKYVFDKTLSEIDEYIGADTRGHVRLGDKFRRKGRYRVAEIQYRKALEKEPENPVILTKYARCLFAMDKDAEAKEHLNVAVENNPNYVTSHIMLADALYKETNFDQALYHYREANAINPFDPHIHKKAGTIYLEKNEHDNAARELSIALFLSPSDTSIRQLLMRTRQ